MSKIMSAKILRHIADLHEAGIMVDQANVNAALAEFVKSSCDPVEAADYRFAYISSDVLEWVHEGYYDFPAAIAKNQRRLDWLRNNPDPTKTPVELWEAAKRAVTDEENEYGK